MPDEATHTAAVREGASGTPIRDVETAEVAVRAALTGHLVLSTRHTTDAPSAVVRLVDVGVAPYLVAASVSAVLAQRLARRRCEPCKEHVSAPAPSVLACAEIVSGYVRPRCWSTGVSTNSPTTRRRSRVSRSVPKS